MLKKIIQKAKGTNIIQICVEGNENVIGVFEKVKGYIAEFREDLIRKTIEDISKEIKENQTVCNPDSRIFVDAFNHATLTSDDELRKMYAKLIATSMNEKEKETAHPGYIDIISQLSPLDAKLFKYLREFVEFNSFYPVATLEIVSEGRMFVRHWSEYYEPELTNQMDGAPDRISLALQHLRRLNLIDIREGECEGYPYQNLTNDDNIVKWYMRCTSRKTGLIPAEKNIIPCYIDISELGAEFYKTCVRGW